MLRNIISLSPFILKRSFSGLVDDLENDIAPSSEYFSEISIKRIFHLST